MDLNKLLSMAKQNQSKAQNEKKIGYSTQVKAPKKLEKTVDSKAIKAFLNRRKEIKDIQYAENLKKKQELVRLREDQKTTKKAKAMATRTKDNLKVFHGNQMSKQPRKTDDDVILSPEAELKHKMFMKNLMSSNKLSGSEDDKELQKNKKKPHENERNARRKLKKSQEIARQRLDYNDILNLAQKQSEKTVDESSSDEPSDDDISSDELSAEERYAREKQKRKQLEAQLKAMKRKNNNSSSEPSFKIAKLNKGLSEESKQVKVKALMARFKQKSSSKSTSATFEKNQDQVHKRKDIADKCKETASIKPRNGFKKNCSDKYMPPPPRSSSSSKSSNSDLRSQSHKPSNGHFKFPSKSDVKISSDRHKLNGVSKPKDKLSISQDSKSNLKSRAIPAKRPSNPYAKLMEEAKLNADRKCTLSVSSSVVRTNYPGVSMTDPERPTYEKLKSRFRATPAELKTGPTREMIEAFRRRQASKERGIPRRPQILLDDDSDDYDSEMESFIDDNDNEIDAPSNAISAAIGKIFGYDKNKYGRESEYELSKMDASFKDIEREEKRSLKIAQQEDALEAKRLMEEEARKKKRKK